MIFIDKMKNLKIYKTPMFLPTLEKDKKKKSSIFLMTPNYDSSKKLIDNPLFINKLRFSSYFIDRDVSYYINSKLVKKVDNEFDGLNESVQFENINESTNINKKGVYCVSSSSDLSLLNPRVPENYMTKNGFEDSETKRVCFAPTIDQCLMGLSQNLKDKEFYVYIPDGDYKLYYPSVKEVPDSKITNEIWIKEPVKVKLIGKIKVLSDDGKSGKKFKYGNNKEAELFGWNYKWISAVKESYIYESVDKSKLDKNFKKKSGKKFKYIDIKTNKSKVEKYLSEDKTYNNTYKKYIDKINGEIAIDEETDKLAGYVFIINQFITPLFVVKEYRGYNLGDTLTKDAVNKYKARRLWVYKDNEVAINLYKKYGFKTYIEDDEPSILMATDKKYAENINESSSLYSTLDSELLLRELGESVLNTGDKVILFNEDAKNDPQLRKLLYTDRMKTRQEVILLYDQVKKDFPFIKYTFPDIEKYQQKNIFIDLYFYNNLFFQNNT